MNKDREEKCYYFSPYEVVTTAFPCSLNDFIKDLESLKSRCPTMLSIDVDTDVEDGFYLIGSRFETDDEYNSRILQESLRDKRNKEEKQHEEDIDRALYMVLKKRFEPEEST